MASVVPRLTLSSPGGARLDAIPIVPSPKRRSCHPSDLELSQPDDLETTEPFEDNDDSIYSLKIPSPTYQIMFTPRFLMTSCDSEEDNSDGLSENSADDFIFTRSRLPPWSSAAQHVKPLVDRFIAEERRQHNVARLAWRLAVPATPTASTESLAGSSGLDSRTDALETQSSSYVACLSRHESPTIDHQEIGPLLRRTQSSPTLLRRSLHSSKNLSCLNTIWSSSTTYQAKDKTDEIKRWASDISFTH